MTTRPAADVSQSAFNMDTLAVSDRLRLFNFTQRDDYIGYLWVLRAMDRLRASHMAQAHTDDVAAALSELAAPHADAPSVVGNLRDRLDSLADDGVLHRLEDASRAGSLARYRNRQSVYQFSDLGHRAYAAVEGVLAARVQDANLSRLVFSDILRDLQGLAQANRNGDADEIVRRLASLGRVMDDMARRSAAFHLTLGEITRATETSPETFLRFKHALMAHMSEFMAELDRYMPLLAEAVDEVERSGITTLLHRAAEADDRPLMAADDVVEEWRSRWAAVRAWFAPDSDVTSRATELRAVTRAAVSGVIALLRQITESQRGGVNRSTQLKYLAAWVHDAEDEDAAHALMSAAYNLRSARHLGGVHDDAELISPRTCWKDAPGVDVSVSLFRRGKAPSAGLPQRLQASAGLRAELRHRQTEQLAAERAAARQLLQDGMDRPLTEQQTKVLLKLLTRALEARAVVAGRITGGSGGNDVLVMRLVPAAEGSVVRAACGTLVLPGLCLQIDATLPRAVGRDASGTLASGTHAAAGRT